MFRVTPWINSARHGSHLTSSGPRGDSIGRLPQKYPIDRQRTSSSSEVRDHNGESWNGSLPSVFRDSRGPGVRKEGLPLSLMDSPIASRKQCRRIRAAEAAFCAESVEDFEAPRLGSCSPSLSGPPFLPPRINCWQTVGSASFSARPVALLAANVAGGRTHTCALKKREAARA